MGSYQVVVHVPVEVLLVLEPLHQLLLLVGGLGQRQGVGWRLGIEGVALDGIRVPVMAEAGVG